MKMGICRKIFLLCPFFSYFIYSKLLLYQFWAYAEKNFRYAHFTTISSTLSRFYISFGHIQKKTSAMPTFPDDFGH